MKPGEDVARAAYRAYGEVTDWKNYAGQPMPAWEDLGAQIQSAWIEAARVAASWSVSRGSQLRGHGPIVNRADKRERVHATLREGRLDWYRIENRAEEDSAAVHIYDEIGYFGTTAADFVRDLNALKVRQLNVHINSPGGEVWDGVAIHNAIKRHPADVTVRIDGLAASAASFIAMAGDTIIIEPNAQMMIHDAMTLMVGNAAEMRETADKLDKASDTIATMYANRAGGELADWREAMRAETWYDGEEAVAAGLADKLAEDDEKEAPAKRKTAAKFDLSVFRFAGREAARAQAVDEPVSRRDDPAPVSEGARHVDEDHVTDLTHVEISDQIEAAMSSPDAIRTALLAAVTPAPAFDPDVFRAAVLVAATDAPEPYTPNLPANTLDDSDALPPWDPSVFRRSLREATL